MRSWLQIRNDTALSQGPRPIFLPSSPYPPRRARTGDKICMKLAAAATPAPACFDRSGDLRPRAAAISSSYSSPLIYAGRFLCDVVAQSVANC